MTGEKNMKPAKPGEVRNPRGRPPGKPNRATTEFKDALKRLLDTSAPEMLKWLSQIEDPKDRFNVLRDFAEFIHPKLARQEIQQLDKDGDPADPAQNVTNLILAEIPDDRLAAIVNNHTGSGAGGD